MQKFEAMNKRKLNQIKNLNKNKPKRNPFFTRGYIKRLKEDAGAFGKFMSMELMPWQKAFLNEIKANKSQKIVFRPGQNYGKSVLMKELERLALERSKRVAPKVEITVIYDEFTGWHDDFLLNGKPLNE